MSWKLKRLELNLKLCHHVTMKDFSQAWCSRVEFKPHLRGFNSWMLFELGYADSTRSQYHMQIESFIESQAQYYQAYLYAGSPATVRQRICILKKFFDYLLIEGVITDNPLVEHELPKLASKLPTILTEDEVERLYTCLKDTPDELDLFVFFYYTGCRVSEIVGAMWSQVHWKSANFRFTGKGDKDRVFPILPELMEMLAKRYAAYGQKEGVIFPDVTTRFVAYRLVARWGELVGKTITPHSLRHTLATHLMNNGADLLVIRDLLGHKSVETTQRYTHVAKESLAKAYRDVF